MSICIKQQFHRPCHSGIRIAHGLVCNNAITNIGVTNTGSCDNVINNKASDLEQLLKIFSKLTLRKSLSTCGLCIDLTPCNEDERTK